MLNDLEIKNLLNDILDDNEIIYSKYVDKNDLYVITVDKNFIGNEDDDRYTTVGGKGPIKIDLNTHEYERIHYLNFPSKFIEKKPIPDNNEIIYGIKERSYINEKDIFNFLVNESENESSRDYSFSDFDEKVIGLNFKNKELWFKFREFFRAMGANIVKDEDYTILVERELDNSPR